MTKYLVGESSGVPLEILLGRKYLSGESEGVIFTIPVLHSRMITMIRYIDLVVLIKRKDIVIDGCTTYTPYRRERPIKIQEEAT